MKNLIYILILLPSLLFSQETKNMEFVGVRNIKFHPSAVFDELHFSIDSNKILKVTSISVGVENDGKIQSWVNGGTKINVGLDGGLIFDRDYNYFNDYEMGAFISFPFFLEGGTHKINTYTEQYPNCVYTVILYAQEFKLTTP